MIVGNMSFGPSGIHGWMGPGASRRQAAPPVVAAALPPDPPLPPRIWPDHANQTIRLVIGDSTVIASMTTDRAREFARQILNAAFETDTAHRHLHERSVARRPL